MKAHEITDRLYAYGEGDDYKWTCDTIISNAARCCNIPTVRRDVYEP